MHRERGQRKRLIQSSTDVKLNSESSDNAYKINKVRVACGVHWRKHFTVQIIKKKKANI